MNNNETLTTEEWRDRLTYAPKHTTELKDDQWTTDAFAFAEGYRTFLDLAKTEREAVRYTRNILRENGFHRFDPTVTYTAGDKIYYSNRGKAIIAAIIGQRGLDEGAHLIAAHIDSPRLDLKPRPFYEDSSLALLKTHYYGGIKKYQWAAIPLSLHGTLIKRNGEKVHIVIGEKETDPVFTVTDLLPHLGEEQSKRTLSQGIKGEELNILIGSLPLKNDKGGDLVKLNILKLLFEQYGIVEEEFISAEFEAVPAYLAKDVGLDRSLIGAYGQDDRVCAYTALMATLACPNPSYTTITILADKEETGSNSNTGLDTVFFKNFIYDLAKPMGLEGRTVIAKSKCLSADVSAAFDPTWPSVLEKNNAAYLNFGVAISKYTGSRGKSSTNDATAEFMGEVTSLLNENKVPWQVAELGKVDEGGGGTVAIYLAQLDMDVVDIGVPLLSMHSPFEIASKLDIYAAYQAYLAFYR